jgi:hypothetical protein
MDGITETTVWLPVFVRRTALPTRSAVYAGDVVSAANTGVATTKAQTKSHPRILMVTP